MNIVGVAVELSLVAALQELAVARHHAKRLLEIVRGDVGELLELGVRALELRGVAGDRRLGVLAPRDVRVGRHEPAAGHGLADDLDRCAVRPSPLEAMRDRVAGELDPFGDLFVDIAGSVLAARRVAANELGEGRAELAQPRREFEQLEEAAVEGRQPQLAVEDAEALTDIVERRLEQGRFPLELALVAFQVAHVDTHADRAAVRSALLDDLNPPPVAELPRHHPTRQPVMPHPSLDPFLDATDRFGEESSLRLRAQKLDEGCSGHEQMRRMREEAARDAVEHDQPVLRIAEDDAGRDMFERLDEARVEPFGARLGLELGGDVAAGATIAGESAVPVGHRLAADLEPAAALRRVDVIDVVAEEPVGGEVAEMAARRRGRRIADELLSRLADEAGGIDAADFGEAAGEHREAELRIGLPDPIRGNLEKVLQPSLGIAARRIRNRLHNDRVRR